VIAITRESPDASFGPYRAVRRVRRLFRVEHYLPLDVRQVAVYGLLKPGIEASILLRSADGRNVATANLDIGSDRLCLCLSDSLRAVPSEIRFERAPCRFGGTRPWFHCPRCNSRRAVLYGLDDHGSFSCRRCMSLVYSSQDETKMDRLRRRQSRIQAKLAGPYRMGRPKRQHWATFRRISRDLNSVLAKQNHLRAESARKFLDRHGWPRGYRM
jgi:hypothetical protein